jgi:DNA polymerase-4
MPPSPWPRAILHVDMDAFFASVEVLDNPALRGRPVVVGGHPEGRGVVSAASYEARRFGVHSAMPMSRALRLCPEAVVLPGRMRRYQEISARLRGVFERFTPLVEPLSCDEAFLDVSGSQRLFGPAPAIAWRIKEAVRREEGLTASVGVAPNKFVAKIASDLEKPDGLVVVPAEALPAWLDPLPVGKLWGVGAKLNAALERLGIHTIADLRRWPAADLEQRFGVGGEHLARLARGEDGRGVSPESETKSISHETTFAVDVDELPHLEAVLHELADKVAARLRRAGLAGRVVQLKVRYDDFSTVTRRTTLPQPSATAAAMVREGVRLLRARTEAGARPVRLIGIGMADLTAPATSVQSALFAGEDPGRTEALERAADTIRDRLGEDAIRRGVNLPPPDEESHDEPPA